MSEKTKAWEIAVNARNGVRRTLSRALTEEEEHRLEGVVHVRGAFSPRRGPVTAEIKCPDGAVWVIDYDEQSPYHAFIGRSIEAYGFPCQPPMQHRIGVAGHFSVSKMQLADTVAHDPWIVAVGRAQELAGRFERGATARDAELYFVTDFGEMFHVANHPAGAAVRNPVNVLAYSVHFSSGVPARTHQSLWVICPWSYAELEALRNGPSGGLPSVAWLDIVSNQVRYRPGNY